MSKLGSVLIVDDNPLNTRLAHDTLEEAGYEVMDTSNASEGIRLVNKYHPEIVLMDIMMPGLAGDEATRMLKDDPETRETKIIIVSARATPEDVVNGFDCHADDYITKPYYPQVLLERVKTQMIVHRAEHIMATQKDELESELLLKSQQLGKSYESIFLSLAKALKHKEEIMFKVLVIDDDETVGTLIKDVLEQSNTNVRSPELEELFGAPEETGGNRCGFEVIRKTSGKDGIETLVNSMLTGKNISLAFIDITLSDMNGLEVGYQLGQIDDKLKIVYISGWELPEVFAGGAANGPGDSGNFIQKPFRGDEILQYATTLCDNINRETDAKMAKMHSFLNLNMIEFH